MAEIWHSMSNSFGFGFVCGALVFAYWDDIAAALSHLFAPKATP